MKFILGPGEGKEISKISSYGLFFQVRDSCSGICRVTLSGERPNTNCGVHRRLRSGTGGNFGSFDQRLPSTGNSSEDCAYPRTAAKRRSQVERPVGRIPFCLIMEPF